MLNRWGIIPAKLYFLGERIRFEYIGCILYSPPGMLLQKGGIGMTKEVKTRKNRLKKKQCERRHSLCGTKDSMITRLLRQQEELEDDEEGRRRPKRSDEDDDEDELSTSPGLPISSSKSSKRQIAIFSQDSKALDKVMCKLTHMVESRV